MPFRTRSGCAAAVLLGVFALAVPAYAQGSDSATVKLIELLIAKGILSRDQAASLLSQAQAEARAGRAPARRPAAAGAASLATAEPPPPLVPQGTVRVTYVPPTVRDQIAAEVRQQVLGEEQKDGWAAPNALPEWTKRITVYGDIRLRAERILEDPANKTNDNVGTSTNPRIVPYPFQDYNSLNSGSALDTNSASQIFPTLNSTEDRTRYRIRARLGVKADVTDWLKTDIRLATGNDSSPVTENQTLGQGTNFGKYSIWLDRAYALLKVPDAVKYDRRAVLQAYVGRFGNPFWTSDLEYDDNLNFDGAAVQAVAPVTSTLNAWATTGAFQVYNTDFNYANQFDTLNGKFPSRDKYLFGGQAGVDWQAAPKIAAKFAVGLFDYQHVEGRLSSPCLIVTVSDVCDTDNSRPQFLQFGNTLFPIRNIVQIAGESGTETGNPSTFLDPQYYGLASRFDVLDLHGRVQFTRYDPIDVEIEAEYSKNLAFNRKDIINKGPVNNLGSGAPGTFAGGDTAWMVKLEVGKPEITKLNEWNVFLAYKHLDTDSVLDAFTNSDFHGGGTNAKGFIFGADYGIGKNTYLSAHWYSANTVTGPAFRNDVVQVDLNSKF